jgi:hypothetical protein
MKGREFMGKSRRKSDNDIIVSFLGTSASTVTGSCISVVYPKSNGEKGLIILECGLCQDGQTVDKLYNANKKMLEGIGKEVMQSCEYLLLGHSHV